MSWIDKTAFCIKVFERPGLAQACINSIRALWPYARIYVADDSRRPLSLTGYTDYIRLPYDVGCSAGRNKLIMHTNEEYLVQVDDDYRFTSAVDIGRLIQLLEAHDHLVLAGCKCRHVAGARNGWTKYFADIRLQGSTLIADRPTRWHNHDGLEWAQVDTISNFWVARRRLFDFIMWDNRLVIGGEHADFFQRLQASNGDEAMMDRIWHPRGRPGPLKTRENAGRMGVAFVPSMHIEHHKKRPPGYREKRLRDKTYEAMYRAMWGITKVDRWRYRK